MPTKVTSNGRVTIPKRVRDYLGLELDTEVALGPPPTAASSSNEPTGRARRADLRSFAVAPDPVRPPTR